VTFAGICIAVYYWAAFDTTWLSNSGSIDTEITRRRWLERHMIDRGKLGRQI
jgi:hypothetical protein